MPTQGCPSMSPNLEASVAPYWPSEERTWPAPPTTPAVHNCVVLSGPSTPSHSQKGHSTPDLGKEILESQSCPLLASAGMTRLGGSSLCLVPKSLCKLISHHSLPKHQPQEKPLLSVPEHTRW